MNNQLRRSVWSVVVILCASSNLLAAGGTHTIATKGQPVTISEGWPEGVGAIVNDPTRTSGWNSWFSEWPNDVNQYAFEIASTDDLNRLLEKLAATKSEVRQVRLSYLKEPSGLGWVTSVPKDNNIAAIFSLGNQAQIDEWYKRVRKPFGKMEFTAAPVAVPPTLTIFVQNKAVNLDELKIPAGIMVTSGYVPTVFHKFNTKDEEKRKAEAAQKSAPAETLDPPAQAAADKIEVFLKKHKVVSILDVIEPRFVSINTGSADGAAVGNVWSIFRDKVPLGRIKLTEVNRDQSNATITTLQGGPKLEPGDVVIRDDTFQFLEGLRPDSAVKEPAKEGRKHASADIRRGLTRILYFGKPWSQGKPFIDDETKYPVAIADGCVVGKDFVSFVGEYNRAMKEHFQTTANAPQGDKK